MPCSQNRLEDTEQDWGTTFHREDSFIVGYLGFEIGSSHCSKDRWQSCRKQGEKKFERSSNLPHLQRTTYGTFVWPVLKSLQRQSAWDLVFRATIPGTRKHVQLLLLVSRAQLAPVFSMYWEAWPDGLGYLAATFLNTGLYKVVTAKNPPSEQILSHTRSLGRLFFPGSQKSRCWAWSVLHCVGGFHPVLGFLIISMTISIHQIREF